MKNQRFLNCPFTNKDLCIPQPPSQNTVPGGNTGLRLPAPRQAHSPSGHAGTYGDCSNSAGISPPLTGARPGRRCPHFMLKWRYAEVLNNVDLTPTIERNSEKLVMAPKGWHLMAVFWLGSARDPLSHRKLRAERDALIGRCIVMCDAPAGPCDGDLGLGRSAKAEMQRTGLSAGMSATDDRALHIAVDGYTRADRMAIAARL